ncbi:MAG: DUF4013 domain-containing protein [Chloroflexi bacterium]|nr:DUF4013 domain-containing protein [Chloroflexota bacterium]
MNIGRALTYAFEDPAVTGKLVILAALGFIGTITLPLLLVGLVAWAAVMGYLVDLIHNLHERRRYPLPRWEDYGAKIGKGSNVLAAALVYNLPNILVGCCLLTVNFLDGRLLGGAVGLLALCCLGPALLLYNLIAWPMLALGLARYADENTIVAFFQFGDLFNTLRRRFGVTLQWMLVMLVANLIFGLFFLIPCIGWLGAPALSVPVVGYLTALFAYQIDQPGR